MATPFMQLQSPVVRVNCKAPGSIQIPSLDASGNPISLASGYTIVECDGLPVGSQGQNLSNIIDWTTQCTLTPNSTGVLMSWTAAQAESLASLSFGLNASFALTVSNDTGTTRTLLANGQFQFGQIANLG